MRRVMMCFLLSGALLGLLTTSCKNPNLSGGILHFDQKRYERARETLLKAIDQEPGNAEAWLWLGKSYAELDSTQQARKALDKSIALADDKLPQTKSDAENALEHYWSARHNDGLTFAKNAQDARTADKPDEAKKDFRLALNQFKKAQVFDSRKEETPRNMGVCYFNLGQVDSGLAELKAARDLNPNDPKTQNALFDQYRRLGDQAAGGQGQKSLEDAVKFYSEAEELQPKDSDLLFSLGVVYYQLAEADTANKQADYQKATDYFEKTLAVKPDDEDALYNCASLYLDLKQCDKGIVKAKTLLDIDPHKGKYHDLVGRLNDCLGKKNERIAGLVFSRALQANANVLALDDFRKHLEEAGARSDMAQKYREEGKPEEVRSFTDTGSRTYECWFYWARGKAFAFLDGALKYETEFKPVKPKEAPAPGQK